MLSGTVRFLSSLPQRWLIFLSGTIHIQLPAIVSQGVTIVVSPLISLIQDQVSALISQYSIPAAILNSTTTETVAKQIYRDLYSVRKGREPSIKLLYVTPERIQSESLQEMLATLNEWVSVCILFRLFKVVRVLVETDSGFSCLSSQIQEMLARFVIDEAHCVSAWGHDFRTTYKQLNVLRDYYPDVPIMALTATATEAVKKDVIKVLNIHSCRQFFGGFNRPNLFFEVRTKLKDKIAAKDDILELLLNPKSGCFQCTGIIYCMTQVSLEE